MNFAWVHKLVFPVTFHHIQRHKCPLLMDNCKELWTYYVVLYPLVLTSEGFFHWFHYWICILWCVLGCLNNLPLCILRLCVVILVLYSKDHYCKYLKTSKWWWLPECDDNTKFLCGHLNILLLHMDWAFKFALWLFTSCHFHRLLAHALVNQRMEMQTIVHRQ